MASPPTHDAAPLREMKWSPAEKAIARRAFDLALRRELEAVVREAKDRAAKIIRAIFVKTALPERLLMP